MKTFLKLFLSLIAIALVAASVYFLAEYLNGFYVVKPPVVQLIGSIVGGVAGIVLNSVVAVMRNEVVEYIESEPRETMIPVQAVRKEEEPQQEEEEIEDITMPITRIEEHEEMLDKTMVQPIILENGVVSDVELPKEDSWPKVDDNVDVDDITRVFAPVTEKSVPVQAAVPTVELISPLGPKVVRKPAEEEKIDVSIPDISSVNVEDELDETMTEENMLRADLSETQENYIQNSEMSYIGADGRPQFRITQNIEKVNDIPEDEMSEDFVGYDNIAERRDRISSILNGIITVLFIALAIAVIFLLYMKFF